MDLTVKAPEVTCCFTAINITSYVYAHCDFNEAAFMVGSAVLCKYSGKLMWCCVSSPLPGSRPVCRVNSPGAADHSWDSVQLGSPWPISVHTLTCMGTLRYAIETLANNTTHSKQSHTHTHTKHLHMCHASFLLRWVCSCHNFADVLAMGTWALNLYKFSSQSFGWNSGFWNDNESVGRDLPHGTVSSVETEEIE